MNKSIYICDFDAGVQALHTSILTHTGDKRSNGLAVGFIPQCGIHDAG